MRFRFASASLLSLGLAACGANPPSEALPERVGSVDEPIVGGTVDSENTGVVSLITLFNGASLVGYCSGTLLAPNLVLTARHCISLKTGALDGPVTCGVTKFSTTGQGDLSVASAATVRPQDPHSPDFYEAADFRVAPGDSNVCGDDVALIILRGAGLPATVAEPIVPRIDSPPSAGDKFSAVGYGFSEPGDGAPDGTRIRADGYIVTCDGLDCATRTSSVSTTEWASQDAHLCEGDSGGPALDSEGRVMGVASRGGDGCVGGVYSDVSSFSDFIVTTALDAAKLGGYEAPAWAQGTAASVPDAAGSPSSTTASTGGSTSAEAPLGQSCTSACIDGYACYANGDASTGICVPHCSASNTECPATYSCNASLGVCTPASAGNGGPSGGCAVSTPHRTRGADLSPVALLALAAMFGRRARIRRRRV